MRPVVGSVAGLVLVRGHIVHIVEQALLDRPMGKGGFAASLGLKAAQMASLTGSLQENGYARIEKLYGLARIKLGLISMRQPLTFVFAYSGTINVVTS